MHNAAHNVDTIRGWVGNRTVADTVPIFDLHRTQQVFGGEIEVLRTHSGAIVLFPEHTEDRARFDLFMQQSDGRFTERPLDKRKI